MNRLQRLSLILTIVLPMNVWAWEGQVKNENIRYGINPKAIHVDVMVPEHGMADPHAWMIGDTLYAICGHDQSWNPQTSFPMDRWEVWSTTNLVNWKYHTSILPKDTYIGDVPNCFAGDVCERNGKFYWYFSERDHSTGVMCADKIDGKYVDMLGEPLIPADAIPQDPYDPEVYVEDGVYTLCFGRNTYYMATLAEDMKSLASPITKIEVKDKNGKTLTTSDKSSLFKRGEWYYLVYGHRYAMSKNLYGPYEFQGAFLSGGHTSFFEWTDGQLYVLQENHDICAFYRGGSVKPVFFNEDNTILIPADDKWYPAPGRPFEFKVSPMGWKAVSGTSFGYDDGKISGKLKEQCAIIQSAPWLFTASEECSQISLKIKNESKATALKIAIFSKDQGPGFWKTDTASQDWSQQQWVTIPISAKDKDYKSYTVALSAFGTIKEKIMQIAIQPAANADKGSWMIEEVVIK